MSDTSDIVERLRDCPSYPTCRTLHAEITALRDRLEKAEGALRDMLWAFVDSEDAEEARSIQRTDAETEARAYFAAQEPAL